MVYILVGLFIGTPFGMLIASLFVVSSDCSKDEEYKYFTTHNRI